MTSLLFRSVLTDWRWSSHVAVISLSGIVSSFGSLMLTTGIVHADDVLYDTTDMIDKGTANNTNQPAFIGYYQSTDEFLDLNVADDFELSERYRISSVTQPFRLATAPDAGLPAGAILVEFFENTKIDRPAQQPVAAVLDTSFTAEQFEYPGIDQPCWYFTVDLSEHNIELDPGIWWVSITPVDETEDAGDWRIFRQGGGDTEIIGSPLNRRWSGEAHGTYPPGVFYTNADWAPFPSPAFNLAIVIEGELAASGPLGDLNGDGMVNVSDLLLLLGQWGDCADCNDCAADLTGDCIVNVSDLLELLANWG